MNAYARPESIVETEWVYEHLDDPSVRLVEVDAVSYTHLTLPTKA